MAGERKGLSKTQAAEASKKLILDAAEALFAQNGYDATSFQQICDRAGVTRGLPNYFFGSKEGLYRAVLERAFTRPQALVTFIHEQIQRPEVGAEEILKEVIGRLFDELLVHQTFLRITEWEALHGGRYLGNFPALLELLREGALKAFQEDLGWDTERAEQFLIDLVALCWFPLIHSETFLKPLGLNMADPAFVARRKQHVINILLLEASKAKAENL
jgi:TetR/AcrR family transcriptional regulator